MSTSQTKEALRIAECDNARLREALDGLMREAKAWLEPAGARGNRAMHEAREAMREVA